MRCHNILSISAKESRLDIDKARTGDHSRIYTRGVPTLQSRVMLLKLVSRVSINLTVWQHGGTASYIPCTIHVDAIRLVSLCVFSRLHG